VADAGALMTDLEPERIELDAANWTTVLDFMNALLEAIRAPYEHGYSPDAFNDSMVFGGMNGRDPPYDVVIMNLRSEEIAEYVDLMREVLAGGRADFIALHGHDVEVSIRLDGQSRIQPAVGRDWIADWIKLRP
jgi:hypothetical protein